MIFSNILFALAVASDVIATGSSGCNANNCLRGVRGTSPGQKPPLETRLADCSSFMLITITPKPTTVTETKTVTTTLPYYYKRAEGIAARQVTVSPSVVPAYATYCEDPTKYSSACSCAGVTQKTTVAPTPTVVVYATVTEKACPYPTQSVCGDKCYDLKKSNENCGKCGTTCSYGKTCEHGSCVDDLDKYKCNNPKRCSASSRCGGGCGFCKPDSKGQGWCVGQGTCDPKNNCQKNSDCASSICVDTCCGKTCDNAKDNFCYNPTPRRLFRKQAGGQNDFSAGSDD